MRKIQLIVASAQQNVVLAGKFQQVLAQHRAQVHLINLVALNLPMYTAEQESLGGIPSTVLELLPQLQDTDGIVWITPEYNGGLPPVLNNFIAWISRSGGEDWRRVFNGKKAVLATHSGGNGTSALTVLRLQLAYLGMNVVGQQIVTTFQKQLNPDSLAKVITQLLV